MSKRAAAQSELATLQAEMRQILPVHRPGNNDAFKQLRLQNQKAFDRAMSGRQRASRVS